MFKPPTRSQVKWAIHETRSLSEASRLLRISYNTMKRYAKMYDLFQTNQSGKGIKKPKNIKINRSDDMMFWSDDSARSFSKKLTERLKR